MQEIKINIAIALTGAMLAAGVTPEVTVNGTPVSGTTAAAPAPAAHKLAPGDVVQINGNLYEGEALIEKLDEGDVIVRGSNGKRLRYDEDDIAEGKVRYLRTADADDRATFVRR